MPEIKQLSFKNREVLEMLIKQGDVHEGEWILTATFGFSVGNFGPANDEMGPGGVVVLQALGIVRAEPHTPREMIADAATINPKT